MNHTLALMLGVHPVLPAVDGGGCLGLHLAGPDEQSHSSAREVPLRRTLPGASCVMMHLLACDRARHDRGL
jgi:hypothetical protein